MVTDTKLHPFISATLDFVASVAGASRSAFYRVDEEHNMCEVTGHRIPLDFSRTYWRSMQQVDPLHIKRLAPLDAQVWSLREASKHMATGEVLCYAGFLQRYDVVDTAEMIFRDRLGVRVGLSIFWTRKDVRPSDAQILLIESLHPYISFNLDNHLRGPQYVQREALRRLNLTEREAQIVETVCAGASNQESAIALGISLATVKTHLINVFRKCGVKNRASLIAAVNRNE